MQGQPTRHTMNRRAFFQSAGLALAAIPLASSIALAQGATPAPGGATSRLADMLALVPAMLPAINRLRRWMVMCASYADRLKATPRNQSARKFFMLFYSYSSRQTGS